MAGDESYDDERLTGMKRLLNSQTVRGRANWAKFWFGFYALSYAAWRLTRPPPESTAADPDADAVPELRVLSSPEISE